MGFASKLLMQGGAGPRVFDASSEAYSFLAETLSADRTTQGRRRLTGSLEMYDEAFREHSYLPGGAIVLQCSPKDLDNLLPRILGAAPSGTVFSPGQSFGGGTGEFDILIDRENGVFRYTDCVVAKVTLRSATEEGNEGQNEELVELILYVFCKSETYATAWPATPPTLTLGGAYAPYAHWEGALTTNSNNTSYSEFDLNIDNMMRPIFNNSKTPQCFRPMGRMVTLNTNNPFTTTTLADAQAMIASGIAGTLTFTNGTLSTLINFAKLRNNYKSPNVKGRGETRLPFRMIAAASSIAPSIKFTNDSTV